MTEYDAATGKLRPVWAIRFSPWVVLAACLVGGTVSGVVLAFTLITGPGFDELAPAASVAKGALLVLGSCVILFLLVGPALGWGLAFSMRQVKNHNVHILACAALGLFVGLSVGEYIGALQGISGLGGVAAPAVGIGAAVGRWAISNHAQI